MREIFILELDLSILTCKNFIILSKVLFQNSHYCIKVSLKKYYIFLDQRKYKFRNSRFGKGMFCKETSIMSTKTGAAIQVLPIPYANFSCYNDEIWEAKLAGITIEAVIKSTVLFLMSFATVSVNLIFLMVLRSSKYQRCVQVQVKKIYTK